MCCAGVRRQKAIIERILQASVEAPPHLPSSPPPHLARGTAHPDLDSIVSRINRVAAGDGTAAADETAEMSMDTYRYLAKYRLVAGWPAPSDGAAEGSRILDCDQIKRLPKLS